MASNADGESPTGLSPALSSPASESTSGSSYIGSDASDRRSPICRWRTDEFYDQECSRFFDCPSHVVERAAAESEPGPSESRETIRAVGNLEVGADGSSEGRSSGPASSRSSEEVERYTEGHDIRTAAAEQVAVEASAASAASPTLESNITAHSMASPQAEDGSQPAAVSRSLNMPLPTPPIEITAPQENASSDHQVDHNPPSVERQPPLVPESTRPAGTMRPEASSNITIRSRAQTIAPESRVMPEIVLPRWQPDAEVTYCPICHTQFSIFVRKHHCRKCGRVVCNSCSPHRITIPYQYIVQPPGQPRMPAQRQPTSPSSDVDFSSLGGGERVRLCNPCVPDPNTTPPQPQDSSGQFSPRAHYRSQSSLTGAMAGDAQSNRYGRYHAGQPSNDAYSRSRSVTMASGQPGSSRAAQSQFTFMQSRILAGTPPAYLTGSSAAHMTASQRRHRSMLDVGTASSSSSAAQQRALPPPPLIPEEDECPVCHRELPARNLPNFEGLREAHIAICITSHSTYSGTPTGETPGPGGPMGATPPLLARRTGMFPYVATEKDCVDSAECTICLEEFEVGVPMARLECLCRFHRTCIAAWFVNHPGRCPVHQHDSFGY